MMQVIFDPLQGFFNFLVYRRPTYLRLRKQNPNWARTKLLLQTWKWSGLPDLRKPPTRPYQAPAPAGPPASEKVPNLPNLSDTGNRTGGGSGGQEREDTFPEGDDDPMTTKQQQQQQQQPIETNDPNLKEYMEQARRFSKLADLDIIVDVDLDWSFLSQLHQAPPSPLFLVASQTTDAIRAERTEEFTASSSSLPSIEVPKRASSLKPNKMSTHLIIKER
jgi:hypothetical protein